MAAAPLRARSAVRLLVLGLTLSTGACVAGAADATTAPVQAAAATSALRPDEQAVPVPPDPEGEDGLAVAVDGRTRTPACTATCTVARRPPAWDRAASYARAEERALG